MPHFCGRTHSRREPQNTALLERGGADDRTETFEKERPAAVQRRQPTTQQIAVLAYSYWEARGRQGGSDLEDWLRAERALREG